MKKLFLITSVFVFFFFVGTSHAQINSALSYFKNDDSQIRKQISAKATGKTTIALPQASQIVISPGTFSQDVIAIVYRGNFAKIKTIISSDNVSPIAAFYVVFIDDSGNLVTPQKPINVSAYNVFRGTYTYFIQLQANGVPDKTGLIVYRNNPPIAISTTLKQTNPGFIFAVNKKLTEAEALTGKLNPPLNQSKTTFPQVLAWINLTLLKNLIPTILIVIAAVAIIVYLFYQNKEKNKPRKKIKEPSNIIVGGK